MLCSILSLRYMSGYCYKLEQTCPIDMDDSKSSRLGSSTGEMSSTSTSPPPENGSHAGPKNGHWRHSPWIIPSVMAVALAAALLAVSIVFIPAKERRDCPIGLANKNWHFSNFRSLVTFGDSYSDEGRAMYYVNHGLQFPPKGFKTEPVSHYKLFHHPSDISN